MGIFGEEYVGNCAHCDAELFTHDVKVGWCQDCEALITDGDLQNGWCNGCGHH